MKISKKDALAWFEFFAMLPEDQELLVKQQEIALATLSQIERAVMAENKKLEEEIPGLKKLENRTLYVGPDEKFPRGCKSCLFGSGLSAVRKTNRCNADCRFCYNFGELDDIPPIGEGLWEIGGTRFYEEDLDLLLSTNQKPTGIAYVYLEPFMEIEKYYKVVETFSQAGIHQHLYTNGLGATEERLKRLGQAGLPELRFNLGASHCANAVIKSMAMAKKYIPKVGIETPMTPDFYEEFQAKKEEILATGIDFMNCAELHLNENNIHNYAGEPMVSTRLGYISPIFSRRITLKLMKQSVEENWGIVLHDCSNMTKFARDLNLAAKEGKWFGASNYNMEFTRIPYEAFLPTLKDEDFKFLEEEELPIGYKPGELLF